MTAADQQGGTGIFYRLKCDVTDEDESTID